MSRFKDKVAIVTGGASGIGRALCESLAQDGASVIIADINKSGAQDVAVSLGNQAEPFAIDVSKPEDLRDLVQHAATKYERLDYMFNNAGIALVGELQDSTPEQWQRLMNVNLLGVIYGTMAAYNVMVAQGFGHIVNTSSVTGLIPSPILNPYTTSKWAIIGFSLSLRPEAATFGIKVSVACPSLVRTNIADGSTYLRVNKEEYLKRLPTRWMMEPSDVAKSILRGVGRNRAMIFTPFHARLIWWAYRLCPALLAPLSSLTIKEWRKLRK